MTSPTAKTSICTICAQNGPTCCHLGQGQAGFLFPLSSVEKEAITACDRWKNVCFTSRTSNYTRFISQLLNIFPNDRDKIQALYPEHGDHEHLSTDKQESCVFFGMFYGIAWWGNAKAGAIVGLVISITANLILLPLKNWFSGTASKIYGGRAAHWSLREQLEGDLNQAKHLKYSILIGQHQNICNFFSQYVSLIQAQNIISPVSSGSNRFS